MLTLSDTDKRTKNALEKGELEYRRNPTRVVKFSPVLVGQETFYLVYASDWQEIGHSYRVTVDRANWRFTCNCKAAEKGQPCYHTAMVAWHIASGDTGA